MTKKQILILALAFLLGVWLTELVAAQSQINGPVQTKPGTLATFEIDPPQLADWTITSVETTEKVFQTDTSTNRLYFATPQAGMYHIVAAIVVDGKPQLVTKTLVNGNDSEIKPSPDPPQPIPEPEQPLTIWIKTKLPELVKSQNLQHEQQIVAQCFRETVLKIDTGTIKTAQNARTQLQIALTMSLAFASDTAISDWQPFLTELSQKMAKALTDKVNDVGAVKNVFEQVAETLSETVVVNTTSKTIKADCPTCQPQPRTRWLLQRMR